MTNEQERAIRKTVMSAVNGQERRVEGMPNIALELAPGWELVPVEPEDGDPVFEVKLRVRLLEGDARTDERRAKQAGKTRGGLSYFGQGENQMSICPDQYLRANSTGHLHIRLLTADPAIREPLQKLCPIILFTSRTDLLGLVGVRQCGPRREKVRSRRKSSR